MTATIQRSRDVLTRLALSHDASRFLEIPDEVVVAADVDDVRALFAEATLHRRRVALRGGGTSLSGQAITNDMLIDVRRRFRDIEVLDNGARVRCGAGATVAVVNAALRKYGRRLGPDPASAQAATIGGIVANNASGRLSVNRDDVFNTIDSLIAVLPSGRVVDTSDPEIDLALNWEDPHLAGGLSILRRRLRDDPKSLSEIRRLWSMRNSMGYQLRALTNFSTPSSIIRQLMVGSEGTLGFIAEATFRTVPLLPKRSAYLTIFESLESAVEAAASLVAHGFDAVELFDVDALRVIQTLSSSSEVIQQLELNDHTVLLLELYAADDKTLAARDEAAAEMLAALPRVHRLPKGTERRPLWQVHHGIHTAMALSRPPSTTLLIEDFSVPLDKVTATIRQLGRLFDRFGFERSAITGHMVDGTIHFMLTEHFCDQARLRKFKRFVQAFVRLVLGNGGVLRAQYGTGRVMAPFLEEQVGVELYQCMREIKHLFDPLRILSPEVMFTDDLDSHVTNIKLMPTISDSVDRCIECGLCENVCPSSELTLSPRQRIVLQREIAVRRGDREIMEEIGRNYQYAAIDTCSTASMCQLACPLGIDTGELVRRQRRAAASEAEERNWDRAARNWGTATRWSSQAMSAAKRLKVIAKPLLKFGRERYGGDQVWGYSDDLPKGTHLRRRPAQERTAKDAVALYFPGCMQTLLASPGDGVYKAFNELCTRAGVAVSLLNAADLCCGIPWETRGLTLGLQTMTGSVHRVLAPRSNETVVVDSSACAVSLDRMLAPYKYSRPKTIDVVDFVAETVLPELKVEHKLSSLLLYPSCANEKQNNLTSLLAIAHAIADEVVLPRSWRCCGAHGDRGLLHPELPKAATANAIEEIADRAFDGYASTTRTCELAMARVTKQPFVHVLELLASATR